MIHANELRIGNYIYFYSSISKQTKVLAVWPEWFCNEADQNDSAPIPLTPEVLEKCGFNDFNELWIEDAYGNDVIIQYDFGDKDLQFGGNWYKCEYLHNLQNIIFDLSRKELEYLNFTYYATPAEQPK